MSGYAGLLTPAKGARRFASAGIVIAMLVTLAACSQHQTAQRGAPHPQATITPIYVSTQRQLDETGPKFGMERPRSLNFFRADISVPPTHQQGQVEWPDGPPDAATDFVVTGTQVLHGQNQFVEQVRRAGAGKETLVFVHGFNNTLSESMYRLAQIKTDFKPNMPVVLFSWLSAGDPRGYVYDRDSALYGRDDLERVLSALSDAPGERVFILAHSMGSLLVMETLRQAALRGDRRFLDRINGVILMSPDIDPDLFRNQAEAIGALPQPFLIFVSQQDRALSLAGFITGRKPRLGVIDSAESVAGLGVKVVDFTNLADGGGLNHAIPASSPAAIAVLNGMITQARSGQQAFSEYMVLKAQP